VKVGLNRRQGGAQIACRWGWGDDFCKRLEAACAKALAYSTAPSLRTIASILKNGLDKPDKAESQPAQPKTNSYGITRGAAYFRKGGDR